MCSDVQRSLRYAHPSVRVDLRIPKIPCSPSLLRSTSSDTRLAEVEHPRVYWCGLVRANTSHFVTRIAMHRANKRCSWKPKCFIMHYYRSYILTAHENYLCHYLLLGYRYSVCGKNSSLIRRGLVKRNSVLELPALSFVPLARLPPKLCWPMRAAVVLQSESHVS